MISEFLMNMKNILKVFLIKGARPAPFYLKRNSTKCVILFRTIRFLKLPAHTDNLSRKVFRVNKVNKTNNTKSQDGQGYNFTKNIEKKRY